MVKRAERRLVTILFADIVGSTAMIADDDPEGAMDKVASITQLMRDIVGRFGGTCNRIVGDEVMALFGAPTAREDSALRACHAAHALVTAIRGDDLDVQLRIGLHSGDVMLRDMPNDLTSVYTAFGVDVHVTKRLEELAGPGEIIVSERTVSLAKGAIETMALDSTELKGIPGPVTPYRLLGLRPTSRRQIRSHHSMTPFVGRHFELDELERCTEAVTHGKAQARVLVGEAGIGKTRLVQQYLSTLSPCWNHVVVEPPALGFAHPLEFAGRLVSKLVQTAKESMLLRDIVLESRPTNSEHNTLIQAALQEGIEGESLNPAWRALDPGERMALHSEALSSMVLAIARRGPLLVVVEDLHELGEGPITILTKLCDTLKQEAVFILMTARPEYPASATLGVEELRVGGLAARDTIEMSRSVVGRDEASEPIVSVILNRAQGIPLFVEELAREINESTRGADAQLTFLEESLPSTISDILLARIDRLPHEEQTALEFGALLGHEFPLETLVQLTRDAIDSNEAAISAIRAQAFVFDSQELPEPTIRFAHPMIRETLIRRMPRAVRSHIHREIFTFLQLQQDAGAQVAVELLAVHAFKGGLAEAAFPLSVEAANRALQRGLHRTACENFERALSLTRQAKRIVDKATEFDLRLDYRRALTAQGRYQDALDVLRTAEEVAAELGDEHRVAIARSSLLQCHYIVGNYDEAVACGVPAREYADQAGDFALYAATSASLGDTYQGHGDFRLAREVLQVGHSLDAPEYRYQRLGASSCTTSVNCLALLGAVHCQLGEFEQGTDVGQLALEIANTTQRPFDIGFAGLMLAQGKSLRGYSQEAIDLLESIQKQINLEQVSQLKPGVAVATASAYCALEQWDAVEETLGGPLAVFAKRPRMRALVALFRAQKALAANRYDVAYDHARESHDVAVEGQFRGVELRAKRVLGLAAIGGGAVPKSAGMERLNEALALAIDSGQRPLAAVIHVDLGSIAVNNGRGGQAGRHFEIAAAEFTAMGMGYDLRRMKSLPIAGAILGPVSARPER